MLRCSEFSVLKMIVVGRWLFLQPQRFVMFQRLYFPLQSGGDIQNLVALSSSPTGARGAVPQTFLVPQLLVAVRKACTVPGSTAFHVSSLICGCRRNIECKRGKMKRVLCYVFLRMAFNLLLCFICVVYIMTIEVRK